MKTIKIKTDSVIITDKVGNKYPTENGYTELPVAGIVWIADEMYIHFNGMLVPFKQELHEEMKRIHPDLAAEFEKELPF